MSRFEFPKSMRSRPVYGILESRPGQTHLMVADAEGAEALLDIGKADPALMAKAHVIYTEYPGANHGESFRLAFREPDLIPWMFAQRREKK